MTESALGELQYSNAPCDDALWECIFLIGPLNSNCFDNLSRCCADTDWFINSLPYSEKKDKSLILRETVWNPPPSHSSKVHYINSFLGHVISGCM